MDKVNKLPNQPTSRIDHVPCICDFCHKEYKTSVLDDSIDYCSGLCAKSDFPRKKRESDEWLEKWNAKHNINWDKFADEHGKQKGDIITILRVNK